MLGLCDNERNGCSPYNGFVFKCVSARNVRGSLYLALEKGFFVTPIREVVYKFIGTSYVTVIVRTTCEAVRMERLV